MSSGAGQAAGQKEQQQPPSAPVASKAPTASKEPTTSCADSSADTPDSSADTPASMQEFEVHTHTHTQWQTYMYLLLYNYNYCFSDQWVESVLMTVLYVSMATGHIFGGVCGAGSGPAGGSHETDLEGRPTALAAAAGFRVIRSCSVRQLAAWAGGGEERGGRGGRECGGHTAGDAAEIEREHRTD